MRQDLKGTGVGGIRPVLHTSGVSVCSTINYKHAKRHVYIWCEDIINHACFDASIVRAGLLRELRSGLSHTGVFPRLSSCDLLCI